MQKIHSLFLGVIFFAVSSFAVVAEPAQPLPKQGEQTRQWLELQKNGHAASPHQQTLPGPAAAQIYERYLNSFSHPIPEYFSEVEANPFNSSR